MIPNMGVGTFFFSTTSRLTPEFHPVSNSQSVKLTIHLVLTLKMHRDLSPCHIYTLMVALHHHHELCRVRSLRPVPTTPKMLFVVPYSVFDIQCLVIPSFDKRILTAEGSLFLFFPNNFSNFVGIPVSLDLYL